LPLERRRKRHTPKGRAVTVKNINVARLNREL
jgi:hypothetical protein